jgi:hypothetical protein
VVTGTQEAKARIMLYARSALAIAGALAVFGLAGPAQAQWGPPAYVYAPPPPAYYVPPPPRVYYAPPAYYRPPPVFYAPPPVYYAPPPPPAYVVRPGFSIGFGFR